MSQNPLIDSGVQSSKKAGLKPPLAAALASLEVTLDQELSRYRRTRSVSRSTSQPYVGVSTPTKLQQLTVINTTEGNKATSAESGRADQQKLEAKTATTATPTPIQQENPSVNDTTDTPVVATSQTEERHYSQIPSTSQTTAPPTITPEPNAISIVPAIAGECESQTPKQPEDFLESSEVLLSSLVEEKLNTQKQTNSKNSLLSPLGIGSMLLLILASLTLGFIVFSPKNLPQFSLDGLFKKKTPDNSENTEHQANNPTAQEPKLTPIPEVPNLAESEFPVVKDSNDIVGLKPKAKPTSIASPYPIVTQKSKNSTTVPPLMPTVPSVSPSISTTTSPNLLTQNPDVIQPQQDVPLKPSKDGYYHIITENQGVQAFASARKAVPDAYVSTNGKFIYLGAVKNPQKAQELLQQLQAKGINARIEQP
jgi:hypothetical protein